MNKHLSFGIYSPVFQLVVTVHPSCVLQVRTHKEPETLIIAASQNQGVKNKNELPKSTLMEMMTGEDDVSW